ncbi:hypothetical protein LUZ61_007182 [Rhynchospora tenuis]|uniref:Ribosome biogenesis protein NOP53 n=1 Tax=Rhynchospora tenuis TaxID=198213 RepID=A0AAD5ZT07_9POAL|nr:hypothetical protein LUZ61_007182 [Rhynchospora tenuis]
MGKAAKGSRKGKKAWRANISTADIEDYLEEATRQSYCSLPDSSLPDSSLFFLSSDTNNKSKPKRKTELQREKPLRHEAPLRKNPAVVPLPPSATSKQPIQTKRKSSHSHSHSNQQEEEEDDADIWNNDDGNLNQNHHKKKKKRPTTTAATPIPAVEIEPLGCSFNPPFEAHQDALAKAVADEMQKLYKIELAPDPVPLTVAGEVVPDEEKFFLDADDGHESNNEDTNQGEEDLSASRKSNTKKVTRVELNRRARRKELLRAEAEAKKIQNLSKEIDSLPDILKEIEKEDEEKEKRHTRRVVAKQERLKTAPPRLGKPKFVPPPVQVLLTEEITGSLRKLKGCCTLARDRFKSLEKRALIVPRSNKRHRY